jgi:uncharacterized membrane protein YccC
MEPAVRQVIEAPRDLVLWIGGLSLTSMGAVVLFVLRLYFSQDAEKKAKATEALADASFKANVMADLKTILQMQGQQTLAIELLKKDITTLFADQKHLDRRQDEQAKAHQEGRAQILREVELRFEKAAGR